MTDEQVKQAVRAVFLRYKPTYRFYRRLYTDIQAAFPEWCKDARSYMAVTWWASGQKIPDPVLVAFLVQNGSGYVHDLFTELIPFVCTSPVQTDK